MERFYLKSELAREMGLTWKTLLLKIAHLIPKLETEHGYKPRQHLLSPAICIAIRQHLKGENLEKSGEKAK